MVHFVSAFAIVRPARLQTKLEAERVDYTGEFSLADMKNWVKSNM